MYAKRLAFAVVAPWLLAVAGCGGGGGGSSPTAPPLPGPPPPSGATTFPQFQAQIFTPTCGVVGCHAAGAAQGGLVLEAGQAYGNLINVPSTQRPELNRVTPGQPEQSYLIKKLRGDGDILGERMPRGGPFLNQADIDALIAWINAGAPES